MTLLLQGGLLGSAVVVLPLGVGVAVAGLAWMVLRERARRALQDDLSPEDRRHFAGQDRRRITGLVLMGCLGLGVAAGLVVPPAHDRAPNGVFLAIWVLNTLLCLSLLFVAGLDWLANLRFARRHLAVLMAERRRMLEEMQRAMIGPRVAGEDRKTSSTSESLAFSQSHVNASGPRAELFQTDPASTEEADDSGFQFERPRWVGPDPSLN